MAAPNYNVDKKHMQQFTLNFHVHDQDKEAFDQHYFHYFIQINNSMTFKFGHLNCMLCASNLVFFFFIIYFDYVNIVITKARDNQV